MGRDPPPVLPGRLAAEEAPAEEAAEVWVRWAVLRLALLLMVLPLLLPRRRRPWVLRLWQRVLWRLLLGLLLGLLLWLLQAVVRRPKEDRGNVAAGDLGEGWQFYLVALLQPLGGLLWLHVASGACVRPLCDVRPNERAQVVVRGAPQNPNPRSAEHCGCGRGRESGHHHLSAGMLLGLVLR